VGCQPWTHFQDPLVPRSFLRNWPLVRFAHLCMSCTDHPCSNCSENLPGSSFHHLLSNMQTKLVFFCSKKMVSISCVVPGLLSNIPNLHFMHRNATAVYSDFYHVLHHHDASVQMCPHILRPDAMHKRPIYTTQKLHLNHITN
jgi:hypothetical protein